MNTLAPGPTRPRTQPRPLPRPHSRIGIASLALATVLIGLATWFLPSTPSAATPVPLPEEIAITIPTDPAPATATPESGAQLTAAVWKSAIASVVIDAARSKLGAPYSYASAGPSAFDCSGFTRWAWQAMGVNLPHNSGAQWAVVEHIGLDELQPGDLVFNWGFGGGSPDHVGLYVGDGMMIHAPNSGGVVRYDPLTWWTGATIAAGRVR
jgi:cell wall-associated NlpC family hydrolase